MALILFGILSILAVICAVTVLVHKNPVYCAYSLVGCFFLIAGIYALLGAHFIAIIQVLIYTGAIMVLFIFVVMLINLTADELKTRVITQAKILGTILSLIILALITPVYFALDLKDDMPAIGSLEDIASSLFTYYVVPFELATIVLLLAIIGAAVISRRIQSLTIKTESK